MAMIEINKNPSRRDLLVFAGALLLLFGVIGALRWHAGSPGAALSWWIGGLVLSVLLVAVPRAGRWLYLGWVYAVYPIAWTVSHLVLAIAYFLVATPIAFALRALGRDPMRRQFEKSANSYWVLRTPRRDDASYFRQF